jgi:N utilization substance protein B
MLRRHRAREVALQVLYQDDLNPGANPRVGEEFIARRLHVPEVAEFARSLIAGVRSHRPELDDLLERTADNWSLRRMAATDRNVLRLGAYELLHTQTPGRVAINEAVELAKRFGTSQSAQFVNGILDRFLAGRRDEKSSGFRVQGSADEASSP